MLKRRHGSSAPSPGVAAFLRTEQVGGLILLASTAVALIVANSPLADAYTRFTETSFGPSALHLNLTVEQWATDGLLTVFFIVAGLELKRELVIGELREPRRALLPIISALGGMVIPAILCYLVAFGTPQASSVWAVPVATDIAFALAVLAICARSLPPSLRVFLLSLAIVDDLGAILLIATVFTTGLNLLALLCSVAAIAVYAVLQQVRVTGWWFYLPIGVAAWALLHASGVHATLAGVAIGLATRVKHDPDEQGSPAEHLEHRLQPISAGVCVPLFAFVAAGIPINSNALGQLLTDRAALGVLTGLVVGKTVGVFGAALLAVRLRLASLPTGLRRGDMFAVSVLTGCGFTVSLLIAELAFDPGPQQDRIKMAVLVGSLIAALTSAALLRRRVKARSV